MPATSTTSTARPRLRFAAAAVACVALGLALQVLDRSTLVDAVGSVLYVCLIGLLIGVIRPTASSVVLATAAFAIATVVELLQLTPWSQAAVGAFPPLGLVLGNAFDPFDLAAYAVGAMLLLGALVVLRRQ